MTVNQMPCMNFGEIKLKFIIKRLNYRVLKCALALLSYFVALNISREV